MSDLERIGVFAAPMERSRRNPHWRVGQLVANVAGWADAEIWDVEDGQLLAAAREHLGMPAPTGSLSDCAVSFTASTAGAL